MQSCVKENSTQSYNPKNYYFYLTTAQISQTPYFTNPAFDTISYASDKGDTLTFVKTKTDTTWYCERTTSNPDNNDQNCHQTLHNTYATIKGNGSFDVRHSIKLYYYGTQSDIIEINFFDLNFYIYDDRIGSKRIPFYLDSITVNSKTYFDAIYVFHNFTYSIIAKAYVNKDFGIFQIIDNRSNKTYNLIK